MWREMFYVSTGLALYFASDAFIGASLIEIEEELEDEVSTDR